MCLESSLWKMFHYMRIWLIVPVPVLYCSILNVVICQYEPSEVCSITSGPVRKRCSEVSRQRFHDGACERKARDCLLLTRMQRYRLVFFALFPSRNWSVSEEALTVTTSCHIEGHLGTKRWRTSSGVMIGVHVACLTMFFLLQEDEEKIFCQVNITMCHYVW